MSSATVSIATEPLRKRQASLTFLLSVLAVLAAMFLRHWIAEALPPATPAWALELLNAVIVAGVLLPIGTRRLPEMRPLSSIGLVRRPTSQSEMGTGLAIGWGISLLLLLPALMTGRMHTTFTLDRAHLLGAASGALLLLLNALATQLVFLGLPFRSLVRATSPVVGTLVLGLAVAVLTLYSRQGDAAGAIFAAFASGIFAMAELRTRSVLVPLGLQLGWAGGLSLLFGTTSFFWPTITGPANTFLDGPRWLTGANFGPEASLLAFVVAGLAIAVLWRSTRDYAWDYAHDPIVGAGHPMEIAPPAEHARMEAEAAAKPPALVQIQGMNSERSTGA